MQLYFDTNIFYHAYCPVDKSETIDWLFDQLSINISAICSEWMIIEMYRAFKKQVNFGSIAESDAQNLIDYFISDINELREQRLLRLVPVSIDYIIKGRIPIFKNNLYAADSIHLITALEAKVKLFISFDSHFKQYLKDVIVLNPAEESFEINLLKIIKKD